MAEWIDKEVPKPKEPYKQNLPIKPNYNDYGFDSSVISYSLPEEHRDFRKKIQNEIIMEEIRTQNVLGKHVSEEINRNISNTNTRATEIKNHVATKADYVINTLQPKIETVKQKVDTVEQKVEENKGLLNRLIGLLSI